jgi:asparagine synthase (glutamine-hydrolysing)
MCGISGTVHRDPAFSVSLTAVQAMNDTLAHRGPDDTGQHVEAGAAIGSRRLAILDLSPRGHMPMGTPDGRYWITYNGEIYNYRELRSGLESRGYHFRSTTDTEVLLYLYVDQGPAMLDQLNGMFALGIWDARERTLFLARDRQGIKPLYCARQGDLFHFASEQKALFAAGVPPRFDPAVWEELLCFGYTAGDATPFEGVRRLLPGHYLLWRRGEVEVRRWWRLADRARALRETPPPDPAAWFEATFESAVSMRRVSDVPVGVLLSGGLDSGSVVAALAACTEERFPAFTVRFTEPGYDEGMLARQVVGRWGLEHHELTVSPEELCDRLHEGSWLSDEPLAHASDLHLWAISRFAKPRVTVLLSGQGADETLGGYVRYRPLHYPELLSLARPVLPRLVAAMGLRGRARKLAGFLGLDREKQIVLYNACKVFPSALEELGIRPEGTFPFRTQVLEEAAALYPGDLVRQAMYSDQHTFLCSILHLDDRMTMGAAIECRVPFLDHRLVEGLAALPSSVLLGGRQSKPLLRRTLGARLPGGVRRGRKWGFAAPWANYLRNIPRLREQVGALPHTEPIRGGPFDPPRLEKAVARFLDGDDEHDALIRRLVMIAAWHRACIEQGATSAIASRR